jgi:phage gpG-like protein
MSAVVSITTRPRLKLALEKWLQLLAGELGKGFLQQKDPWGNAWKPLKNPRHPVPPHNPGSRVLIDFGRLMSSLVSDGAGHIEEVADDQAIFGTQVEYASVHQTGTLKTNRLAARPFLGVSSEMADALAEGIADSLIDQINGLP